MTTIVYRKGVLASDSQVNDTEAGRYGNIKKINRIAGCLVGACGNAELTSWFINNFHGKMFNVVNQDPYKTICNKATDEFEGVVISPKGKVHLVGESLIPFEIQLTENMDYVALGSGAAYAMGAMANGASAVKAIEAAIKHDVNSGGIVQLLKLKNT